MIPVALVKPNLRRDSPLASHCGDASRTEAARGGRHRLLINVDEQVHGNAVASRRVWVARAVHPPTDSLWLTPMC